MTRTTRKRTTKTGKKSTKIDTTPRLNETVVFSWARMNPPTKGHEKLVETVTSFPDADHVVHLSHSEKTKRNPLSYEDKLFYAQEAFGDVVRESENRTVVESLKELGANYENLVMVVGEDRVAEFTEMLSKYSGEFGFESWQVVSAGSRRADSDEVDGVSASMIREAAVAQDVDRVLWGLPSALEQYADEIIEKIQSVYTAEESFKNVQAQKRRAQRATLKRAVSRVK